MANNEAVYIKKNVPGMVFLDLSDFKNERPNRVFSLTNEQPELLVPFNYALSVFTDNTVKSMYESGTFIFSRKFEDFFKLAVEEGLIPQENVEVKVPTEAEILAILRGTKVSEIEKLFNGKFKELAFTVAVKHSKDLTVNVVEFIEKLTNMALTVED